MYGKGVAVLELSIITDNWIGVGRTMMSDLHVEVAPMMLGKRVESPERISKRNGLTHGARVSSLRKGVILVGLARR